MWVIKKPKLLTPTLDFKIDPESIIFFSSLRNNGTVLVVPKSRLKDSRFLIRPDLEARMIWGRRRMVAVTI